MEDIAKALNISAISVSRALNDQAGVSPQLKDKIVAKAQELSYTKYMDLGKLNILVLHAKPYIQDNSNFSFKVQGIEKCLQRIGADYRVEFVSEEAQGKEVPSLNLNRESFQGVIFIGHFSDNYTFMIKEKIKNQVYYTGYSSSFDGDLVWFNFNSGGYKMCEYLIKKGHKNIGFLGSSLVFKNQEKVLGITTALEAYGLPVRPELFVYTGEDFEKGVAELLKHLGSFGAIICQYDYTAMKLIKELHRLGINVPEDISVIGSGNTELSSLTIPSLTTLDLNIEYSCEEAVDLLVKRIKRPNKPYENITINSFLVERDSVKEV